MDARDRRLKKEAIVQAEAYLNRKRGYVTPQEKKLSELQKSCAAATGWRAFPD